MLDRMAAFAETTPDSPERDVARDLAIRVVIVGPLMVAICAAFWGWAGLWSAALALAFVAGNFVVGAAIITRAAKISPAALMGAVLGGYIARLAVITAVVLPIRHSGWFDVKPFAISLLVTHLGLLLWETQHVSASLAHPGLKPGHSVLSPKESHAERSE